MTPPRRAARTTLIQALRLAREAFDIEAAALTALSNRVDKLFAQAVQMVLQTRGRVVVMGMGKSGHVGRKIAATLASTGTPRFSYTPPKPAMATWAWSRLATWCWRCPTAEKWVK